MSATANLAHMCTGLRHVAIIAGLVAMAATPVPAEAGGDADHGRKLAESNCARCHVLPDVHNMGLDMAPSFKIMVTSKLTDWRRRFETFYDLRPHANFARIRELPQTLELAPVVHPFELTLKDLDDLMAFVDALAGKYRK